MALPDLDTAEIGWIAYWNHLDHGASDIDPMETTSVMSSYQEYTNGVEGILTRSYSGNTARDFYCRVKDDGWIMVWMPREAGDEGVRQPLDWGGHGYYDLFWDWTAGSAISGVNSNTLAREVSDLHSSLSNSGASTFNWGDVALYSYEAPDATTITWLTNGGYETLEVTPSSETTLYTGWVCGGDGGGSNTAYWYPYSSSNWFFYDYELAARNAVGRGEVQAGTTTTAESGDRAHLGLYLTWS